MSNNEPIYDGPFIIFNNGLSAKLYIDNSPPPPKKYKT